MKQHPSPHAFFPDSGISSVLLVIQTCQEHLTTSPVSIFFLNIRKKNAVLLFPSSMSIEESSIDASWTPDAFLQFKNVKFYSYITRHFSMVGMSCKQNVSWCKRKRDFYYRQNSKDTISKNFNKKKGACESQRIGSLWVTDFRNVFLKKNRGWVCKYLMHALNRRRNKILLLCKP